MFVNLKRAGKFARSDFGGALYCTYKAVGQLPWTSNHAPRETVVAPQTGRGGFDLVPAIRCITSQRGLWKEYQMAEVRCGRPTFEGSATAVPERNPASH